MSALKSAKGEPMPRKALLSAAVSQANVVERYAEKALKDLTLEFGPEIEVVNLGGKGNSKGYRWRGEGSVNAESADEDEETFTEQPSSVNQLIAKLKQKLEAGEWPIPNADALLKQVHDAEMENEEALSRVTTYLQDPRVKKELCDLNG